MCLCTNATERKNFGFYKNVVVAAADASQTKSPRPKVLVFYANDALELDVVVVNDQSPLLKIMPCCGTSTAKKR